MNRMFSGLRVLDITNNLAGPGAAAMLAEHGAEVIHIEKPVLGDDCPVFLAHNCPAHQPQSL